MASSGLASAMGIRDEVAALKRERIITAAVELFYERGYENTTLDAVAEQLKVTKPFIYAHFHSKAELLTEICERGIASALDAIEGVMALSLTPRERLDQLGRRFVTAVLQNQMSIAIFSREEKNLPPDDFAQISAMRRSFDHKLVALLEEGIKRGDFRMADPRMAALAIGGMVSWAYVWYRPNGRLPMEQVAEAMSALILSMAGAEAGALPPAPSRSASRSPARPRKAPAAGRPPRR